jgi:peptidoglycan/LPS O-acetylase OafA/YrhL
MLLLKRRDNHNKLVPKSLFSMMGFSSCLPLLISLFFILINANKLLIFSIRLPIFFLGIFISLAYFQNNAQSMEDLRVNRSSLALILLLGFIPLYLINFASTPEVNWAYGLWFYPFIILTFPFCLLLANLIAWLDKRFSRHLVFSSAMKFIQFCGKYSLEIYLMHLFLFADFSIYLSKFFASSEMLIAINNRNICQYILLTTFSMVLAFLLNQATRYLGILLRFFSIHRIT